VKKRDRELERWKEIDRENERLLENREREREREREYVKEM